jgi:hypothetical protein
VDDQAMAEEIDPRRVTDPVARREIKRLLKVKARCTAKLQALLAERDALLAERHALLALQQQRRGEAQPPLRPRSP